MSRIELTERIWFSSARVLYFGGLLAVQTLESFLEQALSTRNEQPKNARERSSLETRRRLMAAWRELLVENPPARVSIKDITDKAEVSVGSFYSHFKGKGELTQEVALDCFAKLVRELSQIPAQVVGDVESRVRAAIELLVSFAERYPGEFRFLWGLLPADTDEGREFLRLWEEFWESQIDNILSEYIVSQPLSPHVNHAVASRAIWGMGEKVVSWWIADPSRASRDVIVRTLTHMMVYSLFDKGEEMTHVAPPKSTAQAMTSV